LQMYLPYKIYTSISWLLIDQSWHTSFAKRNPSKKHEMEKRKTHNQKKHLITYFFTLLLIEAKLWLLMSPNSIAQSGFMMSLPTHLPNT
jgi:hypothetical protein